MEPCRSPTSQQIVPSANGSGCELRKKGEMAESDGMSPEDDRGNPLETPRFIQIEDLIMGEDAVTLCSVLRRFAAGVFPRDDSSSQPMPPLFHRIKCSFTETAPHLREACGNSGAHLQRWARRGSALRALFVVSVRPPGTTNIPCNPSCFPLSHAHLMGPRFSLQLCKSRAGTITLLALTGALVFMLFFLAATVNAIIISILMSLVVAGGFLAILFACLTATYIGALSVAIFVLSTITISAIIAVLVTTGWIAFFWAVWLMVKKSMDLTKQSLNMTGSALSTYSAAWRVHHPKPNKATE
ncbi:hypothetical protein Taro_008087 [Colocasia esculenta]|uniref:Uncharacterized protein n=1 Tax=Colocasia esculenta TaxID=4460 RepID=A0A843TWQ9_COLES|nr:hypothetical protein [Colocasia esculenta]